MEQRGRKSVARLSVVSADGITSVPRVKPPVDLTNDEAAVWVAVVESKPADWFDASHTGMLADFCRHTVESTYLSGLIEQLKTSASFEFDNYRKMLAAREVESRAAASLATRMRLTQQSTYSARKSSAVVTVKKPWEG
jgi:hypothetical protein